MHPSMHAEPIGKGWEIHQLKAFKEICWLSEQLRLQWLHRTRNIEFAVYIHQQQTGTKQQQILGKEENLISRVDSLYYFKCPVFNKKLSYMKRNRKVWSIQRNKSSQQKLPLRKPRCYTYYAKTLNQQSYNMFKDIKETTSKDLKESMRIISH